LRSHSVSATHDARHARARTAISPQHDVRIEHSDQPLEVTLAGGSQERIDDTPLFTQVRVSVQGFALDTTPRAARELACRNGRAVHDRTDLVERHAEHVVQHECEPLRRVEGLEDHEQRKSHRIGEHRVGFRIPVRTSDDWIGNVHLVQ